MFKTRLRELRVEKDLTQKQLADILHMQNTAISKYELGERKPDQETLIRLAEFFNTTTDYILGNSDIRNPYNQMPGRFNRTNNTDNNDLTLPDEFSTPEQAMKFLLEQNVIMGFGGFDVDKLSDDEKVEFANSLLEHLKLLSLKYKK